MSAMTPEEREVIAAAEAWGDAKFGGTGKDIVRASADLWDAIVSLRASRKPPDPVKELRETWETFVMALSRYVTDLDLLRHAARISRAIAALEEDHPNG